MIGYIGTHGLAHKLDFILQCAKNMQGKNDYHFLFIGAGAEKERLLKMRNTEHIDNVTMLDPVPKTEVWRYISILDLCLINLKKSPLFTTVIPSKIFENAGMEIPIIMGVEGEAKDIIDKFMGLGFVLSRRTRRISTTNWTSCSLTMRCMRNAKKAVGLCRMTLTARCLRQRCLR